MFNRWTQKKNTLLWVIPLACAVGYFEGQYHGFSKPVARIFEKLTLSQPAPELPSLPTQPEASAFADWEKEALEEEVEMGSTEASETEDYAPEAAFEPVKVEGAGRELEVKISGNLEVQVESPSGAPTPSISEIQGLGAEKEANLPEAKQAEPEQKPGALLLKSTLGELSASFKRQSEPGLIKSDLKPKGAEAKLGLDSLEASSTLWGSSRYRETPSHEDLKFSGSFSLSDFSEALGGTLKVTGAVNPHDVKNGLLKTGRIFLEFEEADGQVWDGCDISFASKASSALSAVSGLHYARPSTIHFGTNFNNATASFGSYWSSKFLDEKKGKQSKSFEGMIQSPGLSSISKLTTDACGLKGVSEKEEKAWKKFEEGTQFYPQIAKLPVGWSLAYNVFEGQGLKKIHLSGAFDTKTREYDFKGAKGSKEVGQRRVYLASGSFSGGLMGYPSFSYGVSGSLNSGNFLAFGEKVGEPGVSKACIGLTQNQWSFDSCLRYQPPSMLNKALALKGFSFGLACNGFKGYQHLEDWVKNELQAASSAPLWNLSGLKSVQGLILNDFRICTGFRLGCLNLMEIKAGFDIHILPAVASWFGWSTLEDVLQGQSTATGGDTDGSSLQQEEAPWLKLKEEGHFVARNSSFCLSFKLA